MFNPKIGDWVQYKGKFARVHGATKGNRYLIETPENDNHIVRHWVMYSSITELDPAINCILRSIHEV